MGWIGIPRVIILGALSAMLLATVPAAAAPTDDLLICEQAPGDVAIAACTRAIASGRYRGKDLAQLYDNRGVEYVNKGELDRAISDYNDAIRLDPNSARAYSNRGEAWRKKGELTRAISDHNEAIRLEPKFAPFYYNRGLAFYDKRELERAIAEYNEAIGLDPKFAIAYNNRGLAWRDKGELDRAIADFTEAIRLNPKYARAYNNRGLVFYDKRELEQAIAEYNEAIRFDPKFAAAYYNRGRVWRAEGELDRAITDFNEAIRLDPKFAVAYYNRGTVWRDKGELDRAIADYTEVIRLYPKYDWAFLNRGLAYFYSGKPAALADVNQASELDPKNAYHALWADIISQRNGLASRLPQAIAKIDMTKWPAPVLRLSLGQSTPAAVLAAADDPDAKKKNEQVCQANFYSGIVALRQGVKVKAAQLFRLAADGCPRDFPESFAANAELKQLGQ